MKKEKTIKSFYDFIEIIKKENPDFGNFYLYQMSLPDKNISIRHINRFNYGKSYENAIALLHNLLQGKKCAVAAQDIEQFKVQFEQMTGQKIISTLLENDLYSVSFV